MAKQAQRATDPAKTESNGPVHSIRHRNIKAAIWKNSAENGSSFFSVTIARGYKDEEGNWHDSQSYGYDDLLVIAKLMYDAHSAITAARAKEKTAKMG